jgi:hypothetical protein
LEKTFTRQAENIQNLRLNVQCIRVQVTGCIVETVKLSRLQRITLLLQFLIFA